MTRIALGIEYNGSPFKGWQAQTELPTVQGHLQNALAQIAGEPVQLFCAGRTDAGVHAVQQVAHFDTSRERPLKAWVFGTQTYLPETIAVRWALMVPSHFHARFSACSRLYRYVIYNHHSRPALLAGKVAWYYGALDLSAMQQAALYLIGEHDFSSFRSAECESLSPMRNVLCIQISRQGDLIFIDIEANAFLQHMVRNIVGTLIRIGKGLAPPEWMQAVLAAKDRRKAAETASPHGLYLAQVTYPREFELPRSCLNWPF